MNEELKKSGNIWKILGGMLIMTIIGLILLISSDNKGEPVHEEALLVGHNWIQGTTQSYSIAIESDVRLYLPGSPAPQQIIQRISGTLNMRVFGIDEGFVRAGFQLYPASYTINSQHDQGFEEGLSTPFIAIFKENGSPRSFQFPDTLTREERIILEEAILTFQVVLPGKNKASWTVEEDHVTGKYLAQYKAQQDGSLQKQKTLYTKVYNPFGGDDPAGKARIQIRKSTALIRMSSETTWIRSATVEEQMNTTMELNKFTRAAMKAELELIDISVDPNIALFQDGDWENMLQTYSRKPLLRDSDDKSEEKIARVPTPKPAEQLNKLIDQINGEENKRISSLKSLENILRNHPDMAYNVIENIESPGIKGGTAALLIHTLERAGTPKAQDALVMVMNDGAYREWNHIRAIVALGGVETVTDETLTSLFYTIQKRETDDQANTALLAVGSIGGRLHKTDPGKVMEIRDHLISTLNNTKSSSEAGVALKAMANMRDPALAEEIIPHLNHSSPYVRSAAAQAIGSVQTDDGLELLTEQLMTEQDMEVRSAIVSVMESLGDVSNQSLKIVNGMVTRERDAGTRYHMAKYLGDNVASYPEGIKTLQRLVIADRSSRIRKYAATVLLQNRDK